MSLEIVRQVNAEHPELLQTNIGSTCHQFTQLVIEKLRAQNHLAYLMCKTQGEGQYVPFGFQPRDVVGLDGKTYRCTGVSHDAIWCDGNQFDTIASANDEDHPIYTNTGAQVQGQPVWNAIPPQFWRNHNPPLKGEPVHSPPLPPPTASPTLPDRGELMREMAFLHEFYRTELKRTDGLWIDGHPDFEGIAAWVLDVYLASRVAGRTPERSRQLYVDAIRNSGEWRSKHP